MTAAALYARISTGDQSTEQQIHALREAADRMRLDPVLVVEETGSGTKADRPGLVRVLDAARRREVRAVLVVKMDRLGRSVLDLARNVDELRRLGVRLVAVEQGIDLDPERDDPAARFAANVLGAAAEYELGLIRERTRLGLQRVAREEATAAGRERRRAAGKRAIGRPRVSAVLLHAAADLVRAGVAVRAAARAKGLKESTVRRHLAVAG